MDNKESQSFRIGEILEKIPHRYPMVMLDGVTSFGQEEILGFKNVTCNEPCFQGHFPEAPVLPGVLSLEGLLQLLWIRYESLGGIYVTKMRRVKFRRQVVPGDKLDLSIKFLESDEDGDCWMGRATVEGGLAVEAKIWVRGREKSQ